MALDLGARLGFLLGACTMQERLEDPPPPLEIGGCVGVDSAVQFPGATVTAAAAVTTTAAAAATTATATAAATSDAACPLFKRANWVRSDQQVTAS
jgi:hypothetical protein